MVGKPNQPIPAVPLQPIPVCGEPFSSIVWNHFPKLRLAIVTSSQLCVSNIKASKIVHSLVKFFTFVGLPVSIQSDQGFNLMSGLMQKVMYELGVHQYKSSAYHPELPPRVPSIPPRVTTQSPKE